MLLYPRANTEAGKPAQPVPINPPTRAIQATAAQQTAAHGLALPVTIRAAVHV